MTARRLVLHAGLPKTGSTALQMWCFANRNFLISQGIRYPSIHVDKSYPKHQFIVTALMQNRLEAIRDALEEGDEDTILLSTEGMTNHLYDFRSAALAAFREIVSAFDVTVFVVTRAADAWTKSKYKQSLINGQNDEYHYGTTMSLAEFSKLPRVRQLLDSSTLKIDLAAAYGARNVVFEDYDRDWMTAFLNVLGISSEGAPSLTKKNASMPDWMVPLIQQLNAMRLTREKHAAWLIAITSCFNIENNIMFYADNWHWARLIDPALLDRFKVMTEKEAWAIEQLKQHFLKYDVDERRDQTVP